MLISAGSARCLGTPSQRKRLNERITNRVLLTALVAAVMAAAGCSAQPNASVEPSQEASMAPSVVTSTAPSASARPNCPNPEGQACLGLLKAGTFATVEMTPPIAYTVPDGWQNFEDEPGNFLLVAPGYSLAGVNAGGSDFIGVYTSVRAENRKCSTELEATSDEPGVAYTVKALTEEFMSRPGLVTTAPSNVSVGGLSGVMMDIHIADDWTGTCFYAPPQGQKIVQLLGGRGGSSLDHPIVTDLFMRLYLLEYAGGTLAIEVDDWAKGGHLDGYYEIINQFRFSL
jgi:hypothetical protein